MSCPKTALFIIFPADFRTKLSMFSASDSGLFKLCITASTMMTAPSTIKPKSSAPRLIKLPLTPKKFIIMTANNIANGMTDATNKPARKLPRKSTRTNTTINAPSSRFFSTVPMALFTIFERSRKASTTMPSGKVCWIWAIRAFTFLMTSLLFAPFNIITIPPETSPLSSKHIAP